MEENIQNSNKNDDIDVIIASILGSDDACDKIERNADIIADSSFSTDRSSLPSKVLPITIRKLLLYQSCTKNAQSNIQNESLPLSLRKRLLYERTKDNS